MLSPAALSLSPRSMTKGPRGTAGWRPGGLAASGGAVGVLLGGALTSALDWPAIFLIDLPVAAVVFLGARRVLPAGEDRRPCRRARRAAGHRLAGGADLRARRGPDAGWGSAQTLGLMAGALLGLAAFGFVESRVKAPLLALTSSAAARRSSRCC